MISSDYISKLCILPKITFLMFSEYSSPRSTEEIDLLGLPSTYLLFPSFPGIGGEGFIQVLYDCLISCISKIFEFSSTYLKQNPYLFSSSLLLSVTVLLGVDFCFSLEVNSPSSVSKAAVFQSQSHLNNSSVLLKRNKRLISLVC